MNCEKQGEFAAKVTKANFIQNRFDENEMEIAVEFVDEEQKAGKIYLDLSNKIITAGNNSGRRQCEASLETLIAVGVDLPNQGANVIHTLEGRDISVFGKQNDKGYLNFYLNTRRPDVTVNEQAANAKLQSLFDPDPVQGGGFVQSQAAPRGQSAFSQPPQQGTFSQ